MVEMGAIAVGDGRQINGATGEGGKGGRGEGGKGGGGGSRVG